MRERAPSTPKLKLRSTVIRGHAYHRRSRSNSKPSSSLSILLSRSSSHTNLNSLSLYPSILPSSLINCSHCCGFFFFFFFCKYICFWVLENWWLGWFVGVNGGGLGWVPVLMVADWSWVLVDWLLGWFVGSRVVGCGLWVVGLMDGFCFDFEINEFWFWLWFFQVNWLCGGWWWLVVARFVVVTVVARLMEIDFYMQNQTLKIILRHIFHNAYN